MVYTKCLTHSRCLRNSKCHLFQVVNFCLQVFFFFLVFPWLGAFQRGVLVFQASDGDRGLDEGSEHSLHHPIMELGRFIQQSFKETADTDPLYELLDPEGHQEGLLAPGQSFSSLLRSSQPACYCGSDCARQPAARVLAVAWLLSERGPCPAWCEPNVLRTGRQVGKHSATWSWPALAPRLFLMKPTCVRASDRSNAGLHLPSLLSQLCFGPSEGVVCKATGQPSSIAFFQRLELALQGSGDSCPFG